MPWIEKIAVFDEAERVDQQGRDLVEALVSRQWIGRSLEHLARAIFQHEAGLKFFVKDRIAARVDEVQQCGRLARLSRHFEVAALPAVVSGTAAPRSQGAGRTAPPEETAFAGSARLDLELQVGDGAPDKQ